MKTISIKDGNLPNNVSIFIQPDGSMRLNVEGNFYEIPAGEEMEKAVQKRLMEGEAVHVMNLERRLGRLDIYSRKYESENAVRMNAEFAFKDKYGIEAMEIYNQVQMRK